MNYNDLTYKQKGELRDGKARLDKNGDFFKKEKTQKELKKEKSENRYKQQDEDMLESHKEFEKSVINAANKVYAGKNNIEGIYLSKTPGQLPATIENNWGYKRVDPQYIYFYIKDKNGDTWSSNVDARHSTIMHDYDSNYETTTCIDPKVLREVRKAIFKFANNKIKAMSNNSNRYKKEKEESIKNKHPYAKFETGYLKGAQKELERKGALGESINEGLFDKFKEKKVIKQLELDASSKDPFLSASAKNILALKSRGIDTSKQEMELEKLRNSRNNANNNTKQTNVQDNNSGKIINNANNNTKQTNVQDNNSGKIINNDLNDLTKKYKELIIKRNSSKDREEQEKINAEMKSITNEINKLRAQSSVITESKIFNY